MKPGGRAAHQSFRAVGFGVGIGGGHRPKKVSRSLFALDSSRPFASRARTGQLVTHHTPNKNLLSNTSEMLKHWQTTQILEKERENNIEALNQTEKFGIVRPDKERLKPSTGRGESVINKKSKVQDIFDQCLAKTQKKKAQHKGRAAKVKK